MRTAKHRPTRERRASGFCCRFSMGCRPSVELTRRRAGVARGPGRASLLRAFPVMPSWSLWTDAFRGPLLCSRVWPRSASATHATEGHRVPGRPDIHGRQLFKKQACSAPLAPHLQGSLCFSCRLVPNRWALPDRVGKHGVLLGFRQRWPGAVAPDPAVKRGVPYSEYLLIHNPTILCPWSFYLSR
jgi:hypothetical protein